MLYYTHTDRGGRHARRLSPFLRQVDQDEARLIAGHSPVNCLIRSTELSEEAWTIWHGSLIVGMAGCIRHTQDSAIAWMMGSNLLTKFPATITRTASEIFTNIHHRYPVIFNYILERNSVHRRWLEALGAEFDERHHLPNGDTAVRFVHVWSP